MKSVFLVSFVIVATLVLLRPATAKGDDRGNRPGKPEREPKEKGKRHDGKPREHGEGPGALPKEKRPRFGGDFGKPEDDPNDFKYGDTVCRILGKSGGMAISKLECKQLQNQTGDGTTDESEKCTQRKAIMIRIEGLEEKDKNGSPVGQGSGGHVFKNFARQDFRFDTDDDGIVPNGNVTAMIVKYNAFLASVNANFTVNVYIIKEDGHIMNDNETQEVRKGDVKFSITIDGWDFLDNEGEYLDLDLRIQSPGKPTRKNGPRGGGKAYKMDDTGSAVMVLSEKVQVDDSWMSMEGGYPTMEQHGVNNIFKFRFPKYSQRVFYDPNLSPSEELDPSQGGAPRTQMSLALIGSILMAAWALF